MSVAIKKEDSKGARSGILKLSPGEVLFNEGDVSESLFIIQSGQLRLYKPKGSGFVELAVLRTGEVLGEMAYFSKDKKRSCSANAIVECEVIEISFGAFGKSLGQLNPWLRTIINNFASRLNIANTRVKHFESEHNSYDSKGQKTYVFMASNDVVKVLSTLYLLYNSKDLKDDTTNRKIIMMYAKEIYSLMEAKIETVLKILADLNIIQNQKNNGEATTNYKMLDLPRLKFFLLFFNSEKYLEAEKKLEVGNKCKDFLEEIYKQLTDEQKELDEYSFNIAPLLQDFNYRNIKIDPDDLSDAIRCGLLDEVQIVDNQNMSVSLKPKVIAQKLPIIRFKFELEKVNKARQ
jgi:CRP-like cAMP-binding protein